VDENSNNLAYSWYVVGVLTVAYLFSYMDRSILALLIAPIRSDLGLTDTQISLLHGFAFALFYASLGIPIGRLADRNNRVNMITVGVGIWSVFTATCGLARNFLELFIMRTLVGVGESVLNPCAYSIISDSVPKRLLARAFSIYMMGVYLGAGVAYVVGGLVVSAMTEVSSVVLPVLGEVRTWKTVFFLVGIPGLLVVLVVNRTIKEPARKGLTYGEQANKGVPLSIIKQFARENRITLVTHILGFSVIGLLANGVALWTPTFFSRTYGWDVPYAGILYGSVLLVFGPLGTISAGWLADLLDRKRAMGGAYIVGAVYALFSLVPAIVSPLVDNPYVSLALIAVLVFFFSGPTALAVSALQKITPNEMRGQASAIYLLILNILGIGFGPTLVALITDYGFGDDSALRYSMSIVGGCSAALSVLLLLIGLTAFRKSLERAEAWDDPAESVSAGN